MMNCYEIDTGELWLEADLDIECWSSLHKKWFFSVGIPLLIFWVFGMPLLAFAILFKNRKTLDDEHFFAKYRMLY